MFEKITALNRLTLISIIESRLDVLEDLIKAIDEFIINEKSTVFELQQYAFHKKLYITEQSRLQVQLVTLKNVDWIE